MKRQFFSNQQSWFSDTAWRSKRHFILFENFIFISILFLSSNPWSMWHLSVAPKRRSLTVYIPIDTHNKTKNAATAPLSDPDDTSPDLGVAVTEYATAKVS